MDQPAEQIFLVSCDRSGSTLLRYVMDTHPQVCCPGELDLGPLCRSLQITLDAVSKLRSRGSEGERERWVVEQIRQLVQGLMDSYARAKGKSAWCEKSTSNVYRLDLLNQVLPQARYICLYRNAMDTIYSLIERARVEASITQPTGPGGMTLGGDLLARRGLNDWMPFSSFWHGMSPRAQVDVMGKLWFEKTQKVLDWQVRHPDRCVAIQYESLVLDPPQALQPLFESLGLKWHPELLDQVFSTHHDDGPGDSKAMLSRSIYKSALGKGSAIPFEQIPSELLDSINPLLQRLGYPQVGSDWGKASSPYQPQKPAEPQAGSISDPGEIFTDYIPRKLKEHAEKGREKLDTTFKLVVSGPGGGTWLLDRLQSGGRLRAGEGRAQCVVELSCQDLLAMANGTLNPSQAFAENRIQVNGDVAAALVLSKILFAP